MSVTELEHSAQHTRVHCSYGWRMPLLNNIIEQAATAFGLMAALIAVCGFVGHARPVLKGEDEAKVRHATVIGGLGGLGSH